MVVVAEGCVVVVVVAVLGLVLAVLWLSWQCSGGGVAVTVFGVGSGLAVLNSELLLFCLATDLQCWRWFSFSFSFFSRFFF